MADLVEVMLRTGSLLVHDASACAEAVQTHLFRRFMRPVQRHEVSKRMPRGRRCLEPAVVPAAIQVQPFDRGLIDNGGSIKGHVHMPPQLRNSRAFATAGTMATIVSMVCSTIGRLPRAA